MDDFFILEPLLIARIESHISAFRGYTYGAAELAQFGGTNRQPPAPSCDVIYGGYRIIDSRDDGVARLQQSWYVVPRVRNLRDVKGGGDARTEGGPLVAATIKALLGWRPTPDWKALAVSTAPEPYYASGQLEIPLAFTSETVIRPGE